MHKLAALLVVGMVVFGYTFARLARGRWPHGHPWSGLAFLLLGAGMFLGGNPPTGGLIIYSDLCLALGLISAIIWLFIMPSKSRGT